VRKAESVLGWRLGLTLSTLLLVAGCNEVKVQPAAAETPREQPSPPPGAAGATPPTSATSQTAAPQTAAVDDSSALVRSQLDQLSGRLTLLQDQVIQLKALGQQQASMGQAVLERLQQRAGDASETSPVAGAGDGTAQLDAAIAQLMQVMNGLQGGVSEPYAIASAYTAKGAWILLRYDTQSGNTWLADGGRWVALEEAEVLPAARYQVQMLRADQDLKGYVAVRIDRLSGKSWWLNDRRWQVYQ